MRRFAIAFILAFGFTAPNLHAGVSDSKLTDARLTDTTSDLKLSKDGLLGTPTGTTFKGLLNLDKLSFKNTVGISFRSGAFGGMSQYYMNTITYQASKPLVIQAQVGIENTMFGHSTIGTTSGSGARLVVPYLGVRYQPRDNLTIDISISHRPAGYGYYGGYWY